MKTETPAWGIDPVPDRYRVLGFADSALLWGNLGVSLLVLVAAAFIVPALSLQDAVVAIVAGSLIGNLMLGAAGVVRRVIRKFAVWIVLGSLVYLTWWSLSETNVGTLWDRPAEGGMTIW